MASLEHIIGRFYKRFKAESAFFSGSIAGLSTETEREEYASSLLHRLMFLYFMQKKGFLDGDACYLSNHLHNMQEQQDHDTFYRHFLLRFFHEGLDTQVRSSELQALLGNVPYLGGNLFRAGTVEQNNSTIQIPDAAFERLFTFFDAYQWYLGDGQLTNEQELTPNALGYVFEKYVNQQHMGAYYTRDDVTMYIASNTIIPYLFDVVERLRPGLFRAGGAALRLLQERSECYIPMAIRKSERFPSEIEREYIARLTRSTALCNKLTAGELHCVDDLVTCNLDLCRFTQDVVMECEELQWLEAFYKCLSQITILDPTCGSGAFLLAAFRVLEPLYALCIERMQHLHGTGQPQASLLPHIRRSIITNNLYGVDIMKEAVEVCKLRLYLALLSQVEHIEDIEPLPDIDRNIRAGNALVGEVHPISLAISEQQSSSHLPFHWFIEFERVINNEGFDVIIGNPPYVEYDDQKFPYTLQNFKTRPCSNLYTCVVERSHHLLSPQGRQGMILPLAAFATRNMTSFIEEFQRWFPCTWLSFYHFRPSMLFSGGKVASIPTVIYLAKHTGDEVRFSTSVMKWTAAQRELLFPSLTYCQITAPKDPGNRHYYPKFGNPIENQIMEKVLQHEQASKYLASTSNQNTMYYRSAGGLYWKVFVNFAWPYHVTSNKQCSFQHGYDRDVFVALFNSSLFWWYYTVTFDTFNLKDYMIFGFRFSYPRNEVLIHTLQACCSRLMDDYQKNAQHLQRGKTGSYTIYARKSKPIIDEIDRLLAQHYGFTDEELDFIINYDVKYRMGRDSFDLPT
jgi:hypothetical protein